MVDENSLFVLEDFLLSKTVYQKTAHFTRKNCLQTYRRRNSLFESLTPGDTGPLPFGCPFCCPKSELYFSWKLYRKLTTTENASLSNFRNDLFSTLAWRACQVHLVDLVLDNSYWLYQADLYNVLIFVKNVKIWYIFTVCLTRKYHTQNTTQTGITVKVLIFLLNQTQLHNPRSFEKPSRGATWDGRLYLSSMLGINCFWRFSSSTDCIKVEDLAQLKQY